MQALTQSAWAYPALEVVHLLGIALLLGNLVGLELRFWGAVRELPLAALARLNLSLAVLGFSIAAASGLLMFATQALSLIANPAFLWKMGLLTLAGCNAAAFHARGGLARDDAMARVHTGFSVLVWLSVLTAGRWIAYV
jgi:hypothetical protein